MSALETQTTKIPGAVIVTPRVFGDERGWFKETYATAKYAEIGITGTFVQDNVSLSCRGTLRGLHMDPRMAKLVQCLRGRVFDVAVDLREDSPAYKQWHAVELSGENHLQYYIPAGCAHGFYVVSDEAIVMYKQTALYDPSQERTVRWNDPAVAVEWPLGGKEPILSAKDASA